MDFLPLRADNTDVLDLGEMGADKANLSGKPAPRGDRRRTIAPRNRLSIETLAGVGPDRPPLELLAWLNDTLARCAEHLDFSGELRFRLVRDAEMAAAHQRHCGVPGTTDVITFDLTDGEGARTRTLDVDAMLCLDEARRQAAARGHPIEHELLLYALHSILHCLGYDDHDEAAYERMHAAEDEILRTIGVGSVFKMANGK